MGIKSVGERIRVLNAVKVLRQRNSLYLMSKSTLSLATDDLPKSRDNSPTQKAATNGRRLESARPAPLQLVSDPGREGLPRLVRDGSESAAHRCTKARVWTTVRNIRTPTSIPQQTERYSTHKHPHIHTIRPTQPSATSTHRREGSRPCHPLLHHPAECVPAPAAETSSKNSLMTPASHLIHNRVITVRTAHPNQWSVGAPIGSPAIRRTDPCQRRITTVCRNCRSSACSSPQPRRNTSLSNLTPTSSPR
jgi:mitogen-activated protein kinase kinase kinase